MAKTQCQIGCTIFFVIQALICLGLGLFMIFGFNKVYDKIVDEQIVLQQEEDSDLPKATFWFMHPPVNALSHYHIFNVKNPNEIEFLGHKPNVSDLGPFIVRETENKLEYTFFNDDEMLRYKNYKTFTYEKEGSCADCNYDTIVTIPNLVGIGTLEELLDPRYNVSPNEVFLIDLFMLLVGEYPFVRVRFGDLLFDGYEDALLSAAHSKFLDDLAILNNNISIIPVPVPDMTYMSFFFKYNNTNDEVYEIYTGKNDLSKVGQIETWANDTLLPELWWNSSQARQIRGSDSGGFQNPRMNKDKPISLYQSYMCRSFDVEFKGTDSFRSIDTYRFEGGVDNFDTTLPSQAGFRYSNSEQINYYTDWPDCSGNTTKGFKDKDCKDPTLDCTLKENMCSDCCEGSKVNDTYILPPAMYPINCFPGRVKETPFRLLFTTPHFANSPKEVTQSITGLIDLGEAQYPFSFQYLPRTGILLEANIRFQIAIPIYQTNQSVMASHFPNKIIPVFWVDNAVRVKDNVYNKLYTGFVVVPKIALAAKITLPILALIFLILAFLIIRVNKGEKLDITPQATTVRPQEAVIEERQASTVRHQEPVIEERQESILLVEPSILKTETTIETPQGSISRL